MKKIILLLIAFAFIIGTASASVNPPTILYPANNSIIEMYGHPNIHQINNATLIAISPDEQVFDCVAYLPALGDSYTIPDVQNNTITTFLGVILDSEQNPNHVLLSCGDSANSSYYYTLNTYLYEADDIGKSSLEVIAKIFIIIGNFIVIFVILSISLFAYKKFKR